MDKVLIVDDSALVRRELSKLLIEAGFDVTIAKNGQEAVDMVLAGNFDVVTMDINMPVMDGLTAVKLIMKQKPTPIVMISSLTQGDADITFDALEYGAVDFVGKPGTLTLNVQNIGEDIVSKIEEASKVPKNRLKIRKASNVVKVNLNKEPVLKSRISRGKKAEKVILIGASTGGPGLIEQIVRALPEDFPYPICIVQHMPGAFTEKFAKRLDKVSALDVVEADQKETVTAGKVIIGKGGKHMHFSKKASGVVSVRLAENTTNSFFVPSIDEMFFSAAKAFDPTTLLAIELTGIGSDGADGMVVLKKEGAYTIAESKETATIYGMPRVAFEKGGTVKVLPFPEILDEILAFGRT
jgi:two-component system chemotaxis response regulator CheB